MIHPHCFHEAFLFGATPGTAFPEVLGSNERVECTYCPCAVKPMPTWLSRKTSEVLCHKQLQLRQMSDGLFPACNVIVEANTESFVREALKFVT